jgi:hypothetical protein
MVFSKHGVEVYPQHSILVIYFERYHRWLEWNLCVRCEFLLFTQRYSNLYTYLPFSISLISRSGFNLVLEKGRLLYERFDSVYESISVRGNRSRIES